MMAEQGTEGKSPTGTWCSGGPHTVYSHVLPAFLAGGHILQFYPRASKPSQLPWESCYALSPILLAARLPLTLSSAK